MSAPKSGESIPSGWLGWENLIVNGNAEAGATAQGWTILIGSIDVVAYNSSGFPTTNSPGPPDRGLNFFTGGSGNPVSRAKQELEIRHPADDEPPWDYQLSGYLGGYDSQDDNAKLTATFRDLNGAALGSAVIGPVLAVDRSNLTGLLWRAAYGQLPLETVKIELVLEMTRVAGNYNDGYADNLSFKIAPHVFIGGGA